MKSKLALALALGVSATALATTGPGPVQQKGTPELSAKPLATYGIEVPARSALRSLIPTGWRLFVHKSAELPANISWKPGDQWTDVLGAASSAAGLSTLVDWESKTVFIRSMEVALEENAVRGEIVQAAVTPLPRFEAPAVQRTAQKADQPAVTAAADAETASSTASPVVTYAINTTPSPSSASSQDIVAQATAAAPRTQPPVTGEGALPEVSALAKAILVEREQQASKEVATLPKTAQHESVANAVVPETVAPPAVQPKPADEVTAAVPAEKTVPAEQSLSPLESIAEAAAPANDIVGKTSEAVALAQSLPPAKEETVKTQPEATEVINPRPSIYSVSPEGEVTAPNAMVALAAVIQEGSAKASEAAPEEKTVASVDPRKESSDQTRSALEQMLAMARVEEAELSKKLQERKATQSVSSNREVAPKAPAQEKVITASKGTAHMPELSAKEAEMMFFGSAGAPVVNASSQATSPVLVAQAPVAVQPTAIAQAVASTNPAIGAMGVPQAQPGGGAFVAAKTAPVPVAAQPLTPMTPIVMAPAAAPAMAKANPVLPAPRVEPLSVSAPVVPSIPVMAVNPSVEQQKRIQASAKPMPLKSSADFTYTDAVALNKAQLRTVVQAIANRYGLRMVYIAPDIKMPGPVTLLSQSAEQDLALLKKAMGLYAPINFELTVTGDVMVESKDPAYVAAHRAKAAAAAKAVSEAQPADASSFAAAQGKDSASASAPAAPVVPAMTFTLQAGQSLEDALRQFLTAKGYTQEWKVAGGFDANKTLVYEGNTVAEVLSKVLVPLGISADIFTTDKHIVIRPGNYQE